MHQPGEEKLKVVSQSDMMKIGRLMV